MAEMTAPADVAGAYDVVPTRATEHARWAARRALKERPYACGIALEPSAEVTDHGRCARVTVTERTREGAAVRTVGWIRHADALLEAYAEGAIGSVDLRMRPVRKGGRLVCTARLVVG